MTDYTEIVGNLKDRLARAKEGRIYGYTTGFYELDYHVGRIQPGQLWVVGGYNGTGKSYFILNMIKGILKEWEELGEKYIPPRVTLFSTELSAEDYVYRYVLMSMGLYGREVDSEPERYADEVQEKISDFGNLMLLNPNCFNIYGGVSSYEEIEDHLLEDSSENQTNLVFVDYVQELSVDGKYDEKDTMPILTSKFKTLAHTHNVGVVLVSQMNIYSMGKDFQLEKSQVPGFSFGKQLNSAAHASLVLQRHKNDGELSKELDVHIMKARSGILGAIKFYILPGYNLKRYDTTR